MSQNKEEFKELEEWYFSMIGKLGYLTMMFEIDLLSQYFEMSSGRIVCFEC